MSKMIIAISFVALMATGAWGLSRTAAPAQAVFHGVGPAGFRIEGKTPTLILKEDAKIFTVVVGLKQLTTGIAVRDKHMRDKYLEVEKFPEATLEVAREGLDGSGALIKSKGKLTLHGKTAELPFEYRATCKAELCDVAGTVAIHMPDFGIVIPVYLGVTMKPDITVDVAFQVHK